MQATAERKNRGGNRRSVPPLTALRVWAAAGGRCNFPGCNDYILQDSLTLRDAKLGHIAHIVAAELDGPRGDHPLPVGDRNAIGNLALMCFKHHEMIDDSPEQYPVALLMEWKHEHESRIRRLTGIQADHKTTILRMVATIGSQKPVIPFDHICAAIQPRYPTDDRGLEIALTQLPEPEHPDYWEQGARLIDDAISNGNRPTVAARAVDHWSAFALAPIPFLVHLGSRLGSLAQVDLFQRHRDTNDWQWKDVEPGETLAFDLAKPVTEGAAEAVLSISVSGTIHDDDLPETIIAAGLPVYRIAVSGCTPDPTVLRTRRDLIAFRRVYAEAMATIRLDNPEVQLVHLCAAVPAPIAVMCGIELLPKVHPSLAVYDFHRRSGKFQFALRTNHYER